MMCMDIQDKIKKRDDWGGNENKLKLESHYDFLYDFDSFSIDNNSTVDVDEINDFNYYADKEDYIISAAIGLITGMIDIFWIGEFSLENASDWGKDKIIKFVIIIAKQVGFDGDDLKGAIVFLEKNAKIPSDTMTYQFGGGIKHHLRDFAHHPSIFGLIFSMLTQFTNKCYGVNEEGEFVCISLNDDTYVGKDFYSKIVIGTIKWFLHLVSDMAGSSNNPGSGMGIPGPILSLASEIVSVLHLKELGINSKSIYNKLEMIFEGKSNNDRIKFDLRTEIGVITELSRQSIPVYINRGLIKSVYIIKHFIKYIKDNNIERIDRISITNYYKLIKWDTQCYIRMCTVSSGVFVTLDFSDAFIKSKVLENKNPIGLLLRINFVGIVSFVIAIKNDLKHSIKHKSICKEKLLSTSPNIEVYIIYNSDDLYHFRFDNIYKNIETSKKNSIDDVTLLENVEKPIVSLMDKNTIIYNEIVQRSNALEEIELLIMSLLKNNKISYTSLNKKNIGLGNRPFYINENKKKVIYYFTWTIWACDYVSYKKDLEDADYITIVALVDLVNEMKDEMEVIQSCLKDEDTRNGVAGKINRISIRTFFYHFFGEDEYLKFQHEICVLNTKIHSLIGYSTIKIPTREVLREFKSECNKTIKTFNYKNSFSEIYDYQYSIIFNNYINRGNYLYITGDEDFSNSFISSEWYYKQLKYTTGIEQTAIISGYLKSIEQLMFQISLFSIDTGHKIKSVSDKELIEYTMQNMNDKKVDLTFGSLINYFAHNYSIWNVNDYVKNYIINKLDIYRKKFRNDHFHKDNIFALEEIKEIRIATIELYCLLLGGVKIKFENTNKVSEIKYDNIRQTFCGWVDTLFGGNNLIDKDIGILFFVSKMNIRIWTYKDFNNEINPDNNKMECIDFFNNIFTFNIDNYKYILSNIEMWIDDYILNGQCANYLSMHRNILLYSPNGLVKIK